MNLKQHQDQEADQDCDEMESLLLAHGMSSYQAIISSGGYSGLRITQSFSSPLTAGASTRSGGLRISSLVIIRSALKIGNEDNPGLAT